MIQSLSIKNFRTYLKAKVDFLPNVNIIVGTTNNGKSNIRRAIELLGFGKPRGCSFYPKQVKSGNTDVSVKADDNIVGIKKKVSVSRRGTRKLSETSFYINDKEYSVTGVSVPEEISNALSINELNVQNTPASMFVDQKPTEIADLINDLSGSRDIELRISEYNRRIRSEEKDLKVINTELAILDDKIEKGSFLKAQLDTQVLLVNTLKNKVGKKYKVVNNLQAIYDISPKIDELLLREDLLETLIGKIEAIGRERQELDKIVKSLEQLSKTRESLRSLNIYIKTIGAIIKMAEGFLQQKQKKDKLVRLLDLFIKTTKRKETLSWSLELSTSFASKIEDLIADRRKQEDRAKLLNQYIKVNDDIKMRHSVLESTKKKMVRFIKENQVCIECGQDITGIEV